MWWTSAEVRKLLRWISFCSSASQIKHFKLLLFPFRTRYRFWNPAAPQWRKETRNQLLVSLISLQIVPKMSLMINILHMEPVEVIKMFFLIMSSSWPWRLAAPAWCSWWRRITSRRSSSTSGAAPRICPRRRAGGSSGSTRTAWSRWRLRPRSDRRTATEEEETRDREPSRRLGFALRSNQSSFLQVQLLNREIYQRCDSECTLLYLVYKCYSV